MFNASVLAFSSDLAGFFEPRGARLAARVPPPPAAFADGPMEGETLADAEIALAARFVLAQARDDASPEVRERLALVPELLSMMADEDWCLGEAQRRRVRALLEAANAAEALDAGRRPVGVLLDGALQLERCRDGLHDELADWRDFNAFRAERASQCRVAPAHCHPSRQLWLAQRTRCWLRARRLCARRRGGYAPADRPSRFRVG